MQDLEPSRRKDDEPLFASRGLIHSLRNVLGPVEIEIALAQAMLRRDDTEKAAEVLERLTECLQRCRQLLHETEVRPD